MSVATGSTVVGVFNERSEAGLAIEALGRSGFRNEQIGVMARDHKGRTVAKHNGKAETYAREAAVASGVAGAGIGGLAGLGILAGLIPVMGPAIAAGTLDTILTNVAVGAVLAGLGGTLIGWVIPKRIGKDYGDHLEAGRVVVTVDADDRCESARTILKRHGGYSQESPSLQRPPNKRRQFPQSMKSQVLS